MQQKETAGNGAFVESPKPTALVTDVTTLTNEKVDSTNQTVSSKSKLLRIIAAKRSDFRPIKTTEPRETERKAISDEITRSERVDRDETISISKVMEADKITESIVSAVQDVGDTPEDAVDASKGETTVRYVRCPRKKVEEESISCEREIHFEPQSGLRLVTERAKCNDLSLVDCFRKHKQLDAENERAPTEYLKSCSKTDELRFHGVSRVCINCREGAREECKKTHCRRERSGGCGKCGYSPDSNGALPVSCIAVNRRKRDERCRKKPMICLYCDNPRGECTCTAPIGKCPSCGLPSDVCDSQDHHAIREHIGARANKGGTIRVTSWKPKREIRRYFARNEPDNCYEKRFEELPYQRLDVFSNVMNELQRKMSETVCCTRCRRNSCGGSQVNSDEGRRRVEGYVRCTKAGEAKRKTSNDGRGGSRDKRDGGIVETLIPIRHTGRVCDSSVCGKSRMAIYERPLAKCYYCKSSP
ncbi:PREDICTED: uncharacterized protein LOC106752277 [Dinoponera quadriceps]|uniref:Uncharacterized protein LOC106752277 n=1 Tax=Dinoponera quadriceps TaxID=609295 RepID=A0A6P3YE32_DINQU|nr:PREDICTED: uncharacterized protein LOC106752277 [Dinoponera quadriceps]